MPTARPALSPLWRNALRTWLAATLTIGVVLWAGRGGVLSLGLLMVVVFINENDLTPARSIAEMIGAALVGILTAMVLKDFSSAWPMLGISLLATGALVRGLGLAKGVGFGYLLCWGVQVIGGATHFTWALVFDLAFASVVGIGMAQVATWVFWPHHPLAQLPGVEQAIAEQTARQMRLFRHWLLSGGAPPPLLRSQELLPQIQRLQAVRALGQATTLPKRAQRLRWRWGQAGDLWRQLLRQWLLLEPLLLQLEPQQHSLVLRCLNELEESLRPNTSRPACHGACRSSTDLWLAEADRLGSSQPLLLSIAQQGRNLAALLQSRQSLINAIEPSGGTAP
ncbi:MAG: hypothetical protein ACO3FA_01540 [Vulcanococcus sp.]